MAYSSDYRRNRLLLLDKCLRNDSVEFYMGKNLNDFQTPQLKSIFCYVNQKLKEVDPTYQVSKRQLQKDISMFREAWMAQNRHDPQKDSFLDDVDIYRGHFKILRYKDPNWVNPCLRDENGHRLSPTLIEDLLRYLDDDRFNLPQYDVVKVYLKSLQFLSNNEDDEIAQQLKSELKERDFVLFDENIALEGREQFYRLLRFVMNREVVEMNYRPFRKDPIKIVLHCYQMRQWRGRWFLIGFDPDNPNRLGVYPIDRIKTIEPTKGQFIQPTKDLLPKNYFKNVVGVSRMGELQEIRLRVKPNTHYYLRSKPFLPLKPGDIKIDKDANGETCYIYCFKSYINYELRSTIMSYGTGIEVLSPAILRQEIAEELKAMNAVYQKER